MLRLLRAWRWIFLAGVLAELLVVGALLLAPRTFSATAQLATINSNRMAGASASIAAALGGLQSTGVQATPALIVQLARSNAVLTRVGTTRLPELGNRRIADLLARRDPGKELGDERIPDVMRAAMEVSADNQSGLIRFSVTHRDSAVARRTLIHLVDEVNAAYLTASQAQARAIASAQGMRVDSAADRLRSAESSLLEYIRGNRQSEPYSLPALERTRLERERDFAQSLYTEAITERDAAVGRALEQTPALVVVDPVPAKLKPRSRGVAVKGLLTAFVVLAVSVLWILARLRLQAMETSPVAEERRLAAMLARHRGTAD